MESVLKGNTVQSKHHPRDFTKTDWKEVFQRTKRQIKSDNVGLMAAGVSYYAFLGIFPLIAAFIAIYGLVASPQDVIEIVNTLSGVLPGDVVDIVDKQINRVVNKKSVAGWAAFISIIVALLSGTKAMRGMITAINLAYNKPDKRGFIGKQVKAILFTLGGMIFGAVSIFLITAIPLIIDTLRLGGLLDEMLQSFSWLVWTVIVAVALSLLYAWAPNRPRVKWRWITPGAALASVLWLIASSLFSWYIANFSNYNKTYGSLGAIAILLLWFAVSSFVFILGAEFDSEIERQARLSEPEKLAN